MQRSLNPLSEIGSSPFWRSLLRVEFLLFLFLWLSFGLLINTKNVEDFDFQQSTIEAIVDKQRFAVEELTAWPARGDVFGYNGHLFSNKQPGQAMIGAVVYAHLKVWGFSYQNDRVLTAALIIFFSSSFFTALAGVFLFRMARALDGYNSLWWPLAAALLFGLGTTATVYSGLAHHDTLATAFLLIATYLSFLLRANSYSFATNRHIAALVGLLLGLTITTSMLHFFMVCVVGIYFLSLKRWRLIWPLVVGGFASIFPMLIYNAICFGNPFLPAAIANAKFTGYNPEVFFFLDWDNFIGKIQAYFYLINTYCPVIWLGLLGLPFISMTRKREVVVIASAIFVLVFYVTNVEGLGTCAYGPRYMLPIMPFAALGIVGLRRVPFSGLRLLATATVIVIGFKSVMISIVGATYGAMFCNMAGDAFPDYYAKLTSGNFPDLLLAPLLFPVAAFLILLFIMKAVSPVTYTDPHELFMSNATTEPPSAAEIRSSDDTAPPPDDDTRPLFNGRKLPILVGIIVAVLVLIPLYGVKFPINVDLPEHLIVSKLFLEKLTGVTNLDVEISTFLGYRLSPIFLASILAIAKALGISPLSVPQIVVTLLMILHAAVVVSLLYFSGRSGDRNNKIYYLAVGCFALPAAAAMYSASWFIGFVGYTMATSLLLPAIFFTERFLLHGRKLDLVFIFLALFLVYAAHPFVLLFWLMWSGSRLIASAVNWTLPSEWIRLLLLAVPFLPVFLYNSWATYGTELSLLDRPLFHVSPFVSIDVWWNTRIGDVLAGNMFKADFLASGAFFALSAVLVIFASLVAAFVFAKDLFARNIAVSAALLLFISTWINEEFLPRPFSLWIAWDYRYTTTVFAVCLTAAGVVLIRHLPLYRSSTPIRTYFAVIAAVCVLGTFSHLVETQRAYARFDEQARPFMERSLAHQDTSDIILPRHRWHPDGTLIRLYYCLQEPDCNPDGTMFKSLGGNIWAVKVNASPQQQPTPGPTPSGPVSAFSGGVGSAGGQFRKPRGIDVDSSGNIYVSDSGNARIQKFDPNGVFLSAFGKKGEGPGELREPAGIAIDKAGQIYVVDAGNAKIVLFAPSGQFVKEWKGPEPGFLGPRDVAFGPNNRLYIIDQGRGRVVRFDIAAEVFETWGTLGSGESQFREATGIAAGENTIFVADNGNDRIQVFDLNGKYLREWSVPDWGKYPWHFPDITIDEASKRVYASNGWRSEILIFDFDGNKVDSIKGDASKPMDNPSSLVFSKSKTNSAIFILNTASATSNSGMPNVSKITVAANTTKTR